MTVTVEALPNTAKEAPQKRKRGRPPGVYGKYKPRAAAPEIKSQIKSTQPIYSAGEINSAINSPPKRGRGRPPGSFNVGLGASLANSRHEAFARNIAAGSTITAAYQKAGFEADRNAGAASQCLERPEVASRVQELKQAAAQSVVIDAARVLEELGKIGFATITDRDGDVYSLADLTREPIGAMSIKRAALADLGKYLGLSKETLEHVGPGGGPLQVHALLDVLLSPANLQKLDDVEIETIRSAALKLAGPAAGVASVVVDAEYTDITPAPAGGES